MKFAMHGLQPLLIHMRVNLRRRNIGMPEHFLDDPQIGAVAEKMRRETVPEQMRINIGFDIRNGAAHSFTICQMRAVVSFVPRAERKISLPVRRFTSFGRSVER